MLSSVAPPPRARHALRAVLLPSGRAQSIHVLPPPAARTQGDPSDRRGAPSRSRRAYAGRVTEGLVGAVQVSRIPLRQLMAIDGLDAVTPGHRTFGLVEFDVTTALRRIADLQRSGRRVTLLAFVISSIGRALAEHPELNSIRQGRSVYRFADVDVNLSVELDTPGGPFPHQVTLRRVQDKDPEAVYAQIEQARQRFASGRGAGAEDQRLERAVGWLAHAPRFVRVGALRAAVRSAPRVKRWSGTTFVTSLTKFADSGGFVIPFAGGPMAVSFALGGIAQRAVCRDGVHDSRDLLAVTVIVNHDLVDGAPAARFVRRLQELVESADGLPDVAAVGQPGGTRP